MIDGVGFGAPLDTELELLVKAAVASVEDEGYAVLGQLDPAMVEDLSQAIDEAAAAALVDAPQGSGDLHLLSGLERHRALVEIVDWPPLLKTMTTLLSHNIYVHHSHLDVHPPHPPTDGRRWHRDGGVQGRDMRLMPGVQPRMSVKAAIFLTPVEHEDHGAFELVPRSHFDLDTRDLRSDPEGALPMVVPGGTVVLFDARVLHRRRDNLGTATRKAMFLAYTYRWVTSRDARFVDVEAWRDLTGVRRQLLGDMTWDPFYPAAGELPLEQACWLATSGA